MLYFVERLAEALADYVARGGNHDERQRVNLKGDALELSELSARQRTHNNELLRLLIAALAVQISNAATGFVHNALSNFRGLVGNNISYAAFVEAVENAVRGLFDGINGNNGVEGGLKGSVVEACGGDYHKVHGEQDFAEGNVLEAAQEHSAEYVSSAGGGAAKEDYSHAHAYAESAENRRKQGISHIFRKQNIKKVRCKGKYNNAAQGVCGELFAEHAKTEDHKGHVEQEGESAYLYVRHGVQHGCNSGYAAGSYVVRNGENVNAHRKYCGADYIRADVLEQFDGLCLIQIRRPPWEDYLAEGQKARGCVPACPQDKASRKVIPRR